MSLLNPGDRVLDGVPKPPLATLLQASLQNSQPQRLEPLDCIGAHMQSRPWAAFESGAATPQCSASIELPSETRKPKKFSQSQTMLSQLRFDARAWAASQCHGFLGNCSRLRDKPRLRRKISFL